MKKLQLSPRFQNRVYIALIILISVVYFGALATNAQNVVRKGNTFVQLDTSVVKKSEAATTPYNYQTKDGQKYPIYRSKNGKYFVVRKSNKTGKQYRQYLPTVQKELEK